jgi:hypothetical protein
MIRAYVYGIIVGIMIIAAAVMVFVPPSAYLSIMLTVYVPILIAYVALRYIEQKEKLE